MQITKAIRALTNQHADGFRDFEAEEKVSLSEKTDALEVLLIKSFGNFSQSLSS